MAEFFGLDVDAFARRRTVLLTLQVLRARACQAGAGRPAVKKTLQSLKRLRALL